MLTWRWHFFLGVIIVWPPFSSLFLAFISGMKVFTQRNHKQVTVLVIHKGDLLLMFKRVLVLVIVPL